MGEPLAVRHKQGWGQVRTGAARGKPDAHSCRPGRGQHPAPCPTQPHPPTLPPTALHSAHLELRQEVVAQLSGAGQHRHSGVQLLQRLPAAAIGENERTARQQRGGPEWVSGRQAVRRLVGPTSRRPLPHCSNFRCPALHCCSPLSHPPTPPAGPPPPACLCAVPAHIPFSPVELGPQVAQRHLSAVVQGDGLDARKDHILGCGAQGRAGQAEAGPADGGRR